MKAKSIIYQKVFNLGNYENEKLGIELEIGENESIQDAMQQAKQFVEFNHKVNSIVKEIERFEYVVNNPEEHTGNQVNKAKERIQELQQILDKGNLLLTNK